jgi:hypothetical protein
LAADGATAELRARHAAHYCDVAEAAEAGVRTADEGRWARDVAADFGNLRAAHLWAIETADVDLDARLLVALWNYGLQRLSAEYFRWVEEAFDRLSFDSHALLPDLHGIAALGAWLRGDLGKCMRACEAAFDAEQRLDTGVTLPARMAITFATAYAPRIGDPALRPIELQAPGRFLEIVAWSRQLGDPYWLVFSMDSGSLGMVISGQHERAATLAGRALRTAHQSGSPTAISHALFSVATAVEHSDPERAEAALEASVSEARDVDSPLVLGLSMSRLATLRRRLDRPRAAVPLLLELLDHWDRLGDQPQLWHTIRESAMCLGLLGEHETAVRLMSSAEQAELVMPPLPIDSAHASDLRESLRVRLGEHGFTAAELSGAGLTREEAVVLATRSLAASRAAATTTV